MTIDKTALKALAEAAKNDCGDYVALNDYGMAMPPAVTLDLLAEIDRLNSESLCPACKGSGEGWVMSDSGPDAHHIQVDCPECFGPGTMEAAYKAMKIQRDSQIERTTKAGGELFFMRMERDQLKAESGRLLQDLILAKQQPLYSTRRDADRYRWLRDHHIGDDPESINLEPASKPGLSAAIDAAAGKDESI